MTEWYPDEQLRELATLPRAAAARRSMESRLQAVEAVERQYWVEYLSLTDRLYAELAKVAVPAGLEQQLLRICESEASPVLQQATKKTDWRWIAALVVIGMAVAARVYVLLAPPPPRPVQLPPPALDPQVAELISNEAVEAQPSFEVSISDSDKLKAALAARGLPFDVMVLHPSGPAQLESGGVCDFHGTPAVFTRWQGKGANYTVYQFDGTPLGVPTRFQTTTQTPTALWHGDAHYHVVIWPSHVGKCTWASVVDKDGAEDWFSGVYY
jgi:hypothetical protein